MGIYVARLDIDDEQWAVVYGNRATPVDGRFASFRDLWLNGRAAIKRAASATPAESVGQGAHFACPLDVTSRLFCLGLNYADHREETGHTAAKPDDMLVFGKDAASLSAANADIVRPSGVHLLDYEVELGLIFGRDIDGPVEIDDTTLADYVAGFTICNDVSARDDQFGSPFMQWYQAKSYRSFCPAGPLIWLPDPDEMPRVYDLEVRCIVNGKTVQHGLTRDFIFRPPEAISRLSGIVNIRAGDCLLTGTPGGVALSLEDTTVALLKEDLFAPVQRRRRFIDNQRTKGYLKPGDLVEVEIRSVDGEIDLGSQRNAVVEA